jgi:hypothetical protein
MNVRVYVTDTSSNGKSAPTLACDLGLALLRSLFRCPGTFVNGSKMTKGSKLELQFGDQLDLAPPAKAKTAHASFVLQRVLQPRKLDTAAPSCDKPKADLSEDDNENELTCCLCLEIFHQCVAALPCLHKVPLCLLGPECYRWSPILFGSTVCVDAVLCGLFVKVSERAQRLPAVSWQDYGCICGPHREAHCECALAVTSETFQRSCSVFVG